jgi:hypothetical protein
LTFNSKIVRVVSAITLPKEETPWQSINRF